MKITEIKIRERAELTNRVVALASIVFDNCFVVNEIKILKNNDTEDLFIAMPSRKDADGNYRDIAHPINAETRKNIQKAILDAYINRE